MPTAIDVDGLAVQTADLDDVFLSLTGDATTRPQKAGVR